MQIAMRTVIWMLGQIRIEQYTLRDRTQFDSLLSEIKISAQTRRCHPFQQWANPHTSADFDGRNPHGVIPGSRAARPETRRSLGHTSHVVGGGTQEALNVMLTRLRADAAARTRLGPDLRRPDTAAPLAPGGRPGYPPTWRSTKGPHHRPRNQPPEVAPGSGVGDAEQGQARLCRWGLAEGEELKDVGEEPPVVEAAVRPCEKNERNRLPGRRQRARGEGMNLQDLPGATAWTRRHTMLKWPLLIPAYCQRMEGGMLGGMEP